jgi:hypothetical protein
VSDLHWQHQPQSNVNPNVKSVGQECPTHTGNVNPKGRGKINGKVKGVGQECPTHTSNINGKYEVLHFPSVCSIQSHL